MGKPLLKKTLVAPLASLMDDRLSYRERAVLLALYSFHGTNGKPVYPDREQLALRLEYYQLSSFLPGFDRIINYHYNSAVREGWSWQLSVE